MSNPFETGARKVIPAVLIYAERDGQILMLHRNAKQNDHHAGKWNGLGGKLELEESSIQAAARELEEEAGIALPEQSFKPLGVLHFPNFKPHKNEDWLVVVLTIEVPEQVQPWPRGPEGDLVWVAKDKVMDLNLWAGDRHFLPLVVEKKPFWGTIWYEGEKVARYLVKGLQ